MFSPPASKDNQLAAQGLLRHAAAFATALGTLLLGVFLPVFTGPALASAAVNVIWGSVYGVGFWIVSEIPSREAGVLSFAAVVFGMVVWPLLVALGMYKLAGAIFRLSRAIIVIFAVLLVVSAVWNVETSQVRGTVIYYLPLYTAFMDR